MPRLTFHGHACVAIDTDDGTSLIIDPWLDDNPISDISSDDIEKLDYILATHGHFDHFPDVIPLAKRTGARIISSVEIAGFAQSQGIENAHGMSIGGGFEFPFGYVKMTPALHGGKVVGDDEGAFTAPPGGFWMDLNGKRFYHAGDTALLTDMQLLKGTVDVACLPIGDNFTMGPADAARAVEFIEPGVVIPIHYNTFEAIEQDPAAFADRVGGRAEVVVLEPGERYDF